MKKNKAFYMIYVILLVAVFFGVGLFVVLKSPSDYSKNENRYLEKLPSLSWDGYKKGEFQDVMEKAITDQFPARDVMTGLSTSFRKFALLHDVGDVFLGEDDYYFDKKLEKDFSAKQYNRNLALVKKFFDISGVTDKKIMLIPSPATVLSDKLPAYAKIYDETPYLSAAKAMFPVEFIDVRESFDAAKDDTQLYFRTDHHWTHEGAYLGYKAYMEATGRTVIDKESFGYKKVSEDFYGTMYSRALDMGAVPDTIAIPEVHDDVTVKAVGKEIPLYHMDKLKEKDQYEVYFGGNDPCVEIDNITGNQNGTLLIIKDSFANSMIPLLIGEYGKIVMIDLRYETRPMKVILDTYKPDEVLVLYEISNFASSTEVAKLGV